MSVFFSLPIVAGRADTVNGYLRRNVKYK